MADLAARFGGVRARITLVSSVLVAVVLGAVSLTLLATQRGELTAALGDANERAVVELQALLVDDRLPPRSDDDDVGWQVVGPDGKVVAASGLLADAPALGEAMSPSSGGRSQVPGVVGDVVVRAGVVPEAAGDAVVHVAASLEDVDEAVAVLAGSLAVGVPLTVLLLAALTWWLVGRTLQPVEGIREEVASVSSRQLHRRVPEPRSNDEIARLARTMNQMLARLEDATTAQRRFVADASHELRNPLARLRTQLEVADDGDDVEVLRHDVLSDVVEMSELVDGLLLLARADDDAPPSARTAVDLDEVVLAEVARFRPGADDAPGRRPTIDATGVSGAEVRGDARALARVVRNLLDNAVRHAATQVEVALHERGGEVVLSVTDDGSGVPDEQAEAVFERFTRLDEARTRDAGGAGLGLAIARAVVRRHGGRIAIDTTHHPGTRIDVRLPTAAGT